MQFSRPTIKRIASLEATEFQLAGKKAVSLSPDLLIIMAKDDEFRHVVSKTRNFPKYETVRIPNAPYGGHLLQLPVGFGKTRRQVSTAIVPLGQAGEVNACASLMSLLATCRRRVKLVANIGTSCSLGKNVNVGDVVLATEVWRYLENTRIEDRPGTDQSQFHFRPDRVKPTPGNATDAAVVYLQSVAGRQFLTEWTKRCRSTAMQEMGRASWTKFQNLHRIGPDYDFLHQGRIASGPLLVDSKSFKQLLSERDPLSLCLDMESGGFVAASECSIASKALYRSLVVRGISDLGDGTKRKDDDGQDLQIPLRKGTHRCVAMRRAWDFFLGLLSTSVADELLP